MEVIRCSRDSVVREIKKLQTLLSASREKKASAKTLDKPKEVFSSLVDKRGIAVKCRSAELDTLAYEYLEMLSKKHHLALCFFVERGVPVDSLKQLEKIREFAAFSVTLPHNSTGDSILIFVLFYNADQGELYDIDLFSKTFCG